MLVLPEKIESTPPLTSLNVGFEMMIQSLADTRLSELAIFSRVSTSLTGTQSSRPSPVLGKKIAWASLLLTKLSASFIVDVSEFLASRQEVWLWERLTSLSLTSRVLRDGTKPEDISHMLRGAAAAALSMPRLNTMELWNGGFRSAMLFRYQKARDGQSAVITVRGTSELPVEDAVIHAWDQVARRHRHGKLVVEPSLIDPSVISEYRDAIRHLGLSTVVVIPASLRQAQRKHRVIAWR